MDMQTKPDFKQDCPFCIDGILHPINSVDWVCLYCGRTWTEWQIHEREAK